MVRFEAPEGGWVGYGLDVDAVFGPGEKGWLRGRGELACLRQMKRGALKGLKDSYREQYTYEYFGFGSTQSRQWCVPLAYCRCLMMWKRTHGRGLLILDLEQGLMELVFLTTSYMERFSSYPTIWQCSMDNSWYKWQD